MLRRPLSLLLALSCSVHVPLLARAAAPDDVDARAEALFDEGKFLEAAQVSADALKGLPESAGNRMQRNGWATGAVNSYKAAFSADPTQCTVVTAGLGVADEYLQALIASYGAGATGADDYIRMEQRRDELEKAAAQHGCRAPGTTGAAAPGAEAEPVQTTAPPTPADEPLVSAAASDRPSNTAKDTPPPRRNTRGLAIGVGVSAALSVGMAIGSIITYTQVRKPDGRYYTALREAAEAAGIDSGKDTDMCVAGEDVVTVAAACDARNARKNVYYATAALAGVFAVSTAVLTGLLIHKRRKPGPTAALLRRHHAHLGATPHRGGGASLTAGFNF